MFFFLLGHQRCFGFFLLASKLGLKLGYLLNFVLLIGKSHLDDLLYSILTVVTWFSAFSVILWVSRQVRSLSASGQLCRTFAWRSAVRKCSHKWYSLSCCLFFGSSCFAGTCLYWIITKICYFWHHSTSLYTERGSASLECWWRTHSRLVGCYQRDLLGREDLNADVKASFHRHACLQNSAATLISKVGGVLIYDIDFVHVLGISGRDGIECNSTHWLRDFHRLVPQCLIVACVKWHVHFRQELLDLGVERGGQDSLQMLVQSLIYFCIRESHVQLRFNRLVLQQLLLLQVLLLD